MALSGVGAHVAEPVAARAVLLKERGAAHLGIAPQHRERAVGWNALLGELDRCFGAYAGQLACLLKRRVVRVGAHRQKRERHDAEPHGHERREVLESRAERGAGRLVPERKKREVRARDAGDQNRSHDLERPCEILEHLKEREEVPLRSRRVVARRIGGRVERSAVLAHGEHDHDDEQAGARRPRPWRAACG